MTITRPPSFSWNEAVSIAKTTKLETLQEREQRVAKTFAKRGYQNCIPHKTIKTFNGWARDGFMVKPGERSVRIKGIAYRLFHESQVQPMTADEQAKFKAKQASKGKTPKPGPEKLKALVKKAAGVKPKLVTEKGLQ